MSKQRPIPSVDSRYGAAPGSRAAALTASAMSLFTSILPPPREKITFVRALPLVIFLIAFPLICFLLDRSEIVLFSRLWPFGLIVLAPWLWWMHEAGYSGLTKGRALMALVARLILLGLFIVAIAEPRAVRKDKGLSIIFVVDASASIREEARTDAIRYVLEVASKKPEKDQVGLVFFGRSAAVELPPGPILPYDDKNTVMNVQIDYDGTDISKALSLAAAMLPKDKNGRIVLISDGVETEGNLTAALDDLKAKGIPVDVMPVNYSYENEVWLEHLELPRSVKIGEEYNATVILSSLKKGKGKLTLMQNGQPFFSEEVEFVEGKNRYEVPIRLPQAGYYEYQANIEVADVKNADGKITQVLDFKKENNKAVSHLYLKGKGRVLVVTDPGGDPRDFGRLAEAMRNVGRELEVQSASEFAHNPAALQMYDCIIFANVPAAAFDAVQLDALHEAVFAQGSGFLMVGGPNSYGPGGYNKTPVERALPVSMDLSQKKILPKGALAIVLHTCEFPQGNTWGKNIAKQAIKVLNERDEVCILAQDFGGKDYFVAKLTPAGDFEELSKKIAVAELGDMMSFAPTMQMALNELKASDASAKHVIIISDGDPQPPSPALLQSYIDNKISISTVSVFPHGGTTGNEVQLMTNIAKMTGGRHYLPQNPNQLPSIFIKEATTLRRSAIQNITFTPTVSVTSKILEGIDALPPLRGYVLTTPKERSLTILEGPEEEEVDPVLSTWRYGLGASAAWTSDLSPNWAADWVEWRKYDAFVKQLITFISRVDDGGKLHVRTFASGGQGIVVIDDYGAKDTFLAMEGSVKDSRGIDKPMAIKQVGPNRYEGRFPLTGEGTYNITAVAAGSGGVVQHVQDRFVMPYSQEYLRFRSNPIVLQSIAQKTGGAELMGDATKEVKSLYAQENRTAKAASSPILDWILILLACLIPLDVGLRRVQLDMAVIKGWFNFGRETQPSEETFSKLRARKETVSTTLSDRSKQKAEATRAAEGPAMKIEVGKPQVGAAAPPPLRPGAPPKNDEGGSATSRLLAAKKRVQDQTEKKDE
jgi:uncharacterized membrane protein